MKLGKFWSKNEFDEMQEQTAKKIESRGFWFMWTGLLIAMAVQGLMHAPGSAIAGEWIIFMLGCIYILEEFLRHGLFDRHFKPNLATSIVSALIGAIGLGVYEYFMYHFWLGALISGIFTGALIFVAMTIYTWIYKRQHNKLENFSEEEK